MNTTSLERIDLAANWVIYRGRLPEEIRSSPAWFDELWGMHPATQSTIRIHGRPVAVPRFDQAYGKDYPFSNAVAKSLPVPRILLPLLDWVRAAIEPSANGLFVNWHDAGMKHYHGKHRDSVKGLILGTPITTISFGNRRTFRFQPWKPLTGGDRIDLDFRDRDLVVIPWETNLGWTHEIPRLATNRGRRISVTVRSFA